MRQPRSVLLQNTTSLLGHPGNDRPAGSKTTHTHRVTAMRRANPINGKKGENRGYQIKKPKVGAGRCISIHRTTWYVQSYNVRREAITDAQLGLQGVCTSCKARKGGECAGRHASTRTRTRRALAEPLSIALLTQWRHRRPEQAGVDQKVGCA